MMISTLDTILAISNPIIIVCQVYFYTKMLGEYKKWLVEERERATDWMFKWIEEKYNNGKILDYGKKKNE